MYEDRLNNLTLMSIEHDLLRQMDFEELIDYFALNKEQEMGPLISLMIVSHVFAP